MPKLRSKSCPPDPLQATHEVFRTKLDDYREVRPRFQYLSFRHKRHVFLKDSTLHAECIREVFGRVRRSSRAASKIAGLHVLRHVTATLINHGKRVRSGHIPINTIQHEFSLIKEKTDLHPDSMYKRKFNNQKFFMQVLAADIESQALITYLEKIQLQERQIEQTLNDEHVLYSLSPVSEKYFNDLRMIYLA